MKHLLVILFCLPILLTAQETKERNLLSSTISLEQLSETLPANGQWNYIPAYSDRAAWQSLPEEVKKGIKARGDEALDFTWPTLPATLYLEFTRIGNRSNYQAVYFERRIKLADLVLAEVLTQSGRYLDQIVNGIWAISEETSWCIPAHLFLRAEGHSGLPDGQEEVVDLFAAETGNTIAWTYYFLHEQFAEITPAINERMKYEIKTRILEPLLERTDFWWMGLLDGDVNNWNPWVISNWLSTALIMEDDPELKAQSIHKAIGCLDKFINIQPEDGGCDEGPGYWRRAGASLFDCLDILHSATKGKIDIYDNSVIHNTGTYITKAYVKQPYYLNFADASAKTTPDPVTIYRYGKAVEAPEMMGFGGFLFQQNGVSLDKTYSMTRQLNAIFNYAAIQDIAVAEPLLKDVWLPDLEVFSSRDAAGTAKGFYLAGKGGHNDENHNHNDVGNYIVFYDGLPAIIDVGVEEYRRETFSSDRYSIWTMQSQYHTLPTINGQMQSPGRKFRSKNVQYEADDKGMKFSLDIADTYPEEAKVTEWLRTIEFKRNKEIQVQETYELEEVTGETSLFFVTPCQPTITNDGKVQLREKSGAFSLNLVFKDKLLEATSETITIEDRRLLPVWGDTLYRIKLRVKEPKEKGVLKYLIEVGE